MRRLTIIVAAAEPARFRAALEAAAAWAALGRPARLFLQGAAVGLLAPPPAREADDAYRRAGLPGLAELIEETLALGVECTACQSGLTVAQLRADLLPFGVEIGGLLSLLSDAEEDQLLLA